MTRRWRPEDRHSDWAPSQGLANHDTSEAIHEAAIRIEAAVSILAYGELGEFDPHLAVSGAIRLLERAQLHLKVVA